MDDRPAPIAENQALFRRANEQIHESAVAYEIDGLVPFLCECAEPGCTKVIPLSRDEYAEVRAEARHFVVVPGHEAASGRSGKLVARSPRWVVVAAIGEAGAAAEQACESGR